MSTDADTTKGYNSSKHERIGDPLHPLASKQVII